MYDFKNKTTDINTHDNQFCVTICNFILNKYLNKNSEAIIETFSE